MTMTASNHNKPQQSRKNKGFITIPRGFWDWPLSKDYRLVSLLLYLVKSATHKARSFTTQQGETLELRPLQLATSNRSLALKTGISRPKVIEVLDKLESSKLVEVVRVTDKLSIYTLSDKFKGWVTSEDSDSPGSVMYSAVDTLCQQSNRSLSITEPVRVNNSTSTATAFDTSSTDPIPDGPPQDPLLYPLPRKDKDYLPEHIIETLFKSGKVELGMGGAWVSKEFKAKLESRYTKQQIDAAAESLWNWSMNTQLAKDGTPWYLIYRRQWQNHEKLIEKELKKMEH